MTVIAPPIPVFQNDPICLFFPVSSYFLFTQVLLITFSSFEYKQNIWKPHPSPGKMKIETTVYYPLNKHFQFDRSSLICECFSAQKMANDVPPAKKCKVNEQPSKHLRNHHLQLLENECVQHVENDHRDENEGSIIPHIHSTSSYFFFFFFPLSHQLFFPFHFYHIFLLLFLSTGCFIFKLYLRAEDGTVPDIKKTTNDSPRQLVERMFGIGITICRQEAFCNVQEVSFPCCTNGHITSVTTNVITTMDHLISLTSCFQLILLMTQL